MSEASHSLLITHHSYVLLREYIPSRRCLLRNEDPGELCIEGPQILEQPEQLVVVALIEFLEVAEIVFENFLARVGVEDGDVDVEDEAGRFHQHLAIERSPIRRRRVLLRAISRLVV